MKSQDHILVIDDEKDILDMLQFQLEANGFKVTTAHNGEEGLEILKNIEPDLIVLDLNMPKMDGIEFYKQISDADHSTPYPVILLTAQNSIEGLFEEFNVEAYIAKPLDIDHLIHTAQMILRRNQKK